MSDSRSRFCSTRSRRRCASIFLALNRLIPAASSKDGPPVLRRRLQQSVDLALFDQAVRIRAHAAAAEQVAHVLQAARLPIDQVLALAAAIHAARHVDFGGIDGQAAFGIVEDDGGFRRVHHLAVALAAALEDDVGHVLAAQALGALFAQHPLDGVDNVRLARTRWDRQSR